MEKHARDRYQTKSTLTIASTVRQHHQTSCPNPCRISLSSVKGYLLGSCGLQRMELPRDVIDLGYVSYTPKAPGRDGGRTPCQSIFRRLPFLEPRCRYTSLAAV